ncbi:MAG: hypothetical protein IKP15_03995 [Bacteroidales bacterium]|nr:hypothetical protein [Bacteroidales bacterium]
MKKAIAILVALLAFAVASSAQTRAVGIRGGWANAVNVEASYQHTVGRNFIEADLGVMGRAFSITGVYDFILASNGELNFYAGPGLNFIMAGGGGTVTFVGGIVGQAGMEIAFSGAPLNLSIDWRPGFYFIGATGGGTTFNWAGFALGLRYRF